jgi:hypothetical protein
VKTPIPRLLRLLTAAALMLGALAHTAQAQTRPGQAPPSGGATIQVIEPTPTPAGSPPWLWFEPADGRTFYSPTVGVTAHACDAEIIHSGTVKLWINGVLQNVASVSKAGYEGCATSRAGTTRRRTTRTPGTPWASWSRCG